MRTPLIAVAIGALVAALVSSVRSADEHKSWPKPIVFYTRAHTKAEFADYTRSFEIDPKRADELAREFWQRLPTEGRRPRGPLIGVIDDEYTFSGYSKDIFPMSGYRVNVHTGHARVVTAEDLLRQYGDPFYGGIPNNQLPKYAK